MLAGAVPLHDPDLGPFPIPAMGGTSPVLHLVDWHGQDMAVTLAWRCAGTTPQGLPQCEREPEAVLIDGAPVRSSGLARYLSDRDYTADMLPVDLPSGTIPWAWMRPVHCGWSCTAVYEW